MAGAQQKLTVFDPAAPAVQPCGSDKVGMLAATPGSSDLTRNRRVRRREMRVIVSSYGRANPIYGASRMWIQLSTNKMTFYFAPPDTSDSRQVAAT
eukprot:1192479-Prorocentrum_minimum.AAC.5